ncbi:nuclear transport factor 2 family protein [Actinoplanes sp. NPDC049265]|uniref:nuclear transport factor 2 family protein n=1 Tax=Actinoplanes sp. NPDC049265 TaxID=3363902 RepID=UPI00371A35B4
MSDNKSKITDVYEKAAAGAVEESFRLLLDLFDPDVDIHETPITPWGGEFHGRDEMIEMFSKLSTYLGPEPIKIRGIFGEEDSVVVRFLGNFKADPDAEPVSIDVVEWYTFRDGLIVDLRVFYWEPIRAQ